LARRNPCCLLLLWEKNSINKRVRKSGKIGSDVSPKIIMTMIFSYYFYFGFIFGKKKKRLKKSIFSSLDVFISNDKTTHLFECLNITVGL